MRSEDGQHRRRRRRHWNDVPASAPVVMLVLITVAVYAAV